MKAVDWQRFFEEQRGAHNKILFTVTELANVAGTSRRALNVELSRLVDQRIVVHYAYGVYGPPANVSVEMLVVVEPRIARIYANGEREPGCPLMRAIEGYGLV